MKFGQSANSDPSHRFASLQGGTASHLNTYTGAGPVSARSNPVASSDEYTELTNPLHGNVTEFTDLHNLAFPSRPRMWVERSMSDSRNRVPAK